MRDIVYILKQAYNTIKNDRKTKKVVVLVWIWYLSYYIVRMFSPLAQSALLDGAVSLFDEAPQYMILAVGAIELFLIELFKYFYYIQVIPLELFSNMKITSKIQAFIYDKLCKISYSSFNSPELFEKLNIVSENFASYCANYLSGTTLTSIIGTVISFVFTAIVLFRIHPTVAVIMISANLFGIFKTHLEAKFNYYEIVGNMKNRRIADSYSEQLFDRSKLKEVKLFGLTDYLYNMWRKHTKAVNLKTLKYNALFSLMDFATNLIASGLKVTALIITAKMILDGKLSLGSFLLVYSSSGSLIDTSGTLFHSIKNIKMASYYAKHFREFDALNEIEPEITTNENSEDIPADIEFKNISFRYEGSEKDILSNFSLKIKQGEKIAIVGTNGCGKTTFVSLLNRLYAPTSGQILISGKPIEDCMPYLRRKFITLFQDFVQYETSLRENISMGDVQHKYSDEEILKCCEKADIKDFVEAKEFGLATPIGTYQENGINLSGGEWQKLAIARSMLRPDRKVIIMDEPNAALDPISEANIYKRIFDNIRDETLILISHRLGAIKYVDRIIVINNGAVAEDGNHEDLMQLRGLYYEMYTAQAKWYEL